MRADHQPGPGEFRRGWPVVLAAGLGAGLGISGLLTYTGGLFQPYLAEEIGLGLGQYGAAIFGSTLTIALAVPFLGRMVDRHGPRRVAAQGAILLAIGFVALAYLSIAPVSYIAVMAAVGLFASGSTPVPFTRAVSATFDRSRGLALGLTQVGIGLSAALVPPLIAIVIAHHGWRAGFLALAVLAALGAIPAILALPGPIRTAGAADAPVAPAPLWRSALFRVQFAAFVSMSFAFAGMLSHFVPMLRGSGMDIVSAGATAGVIGLSVIASRIVIGWLADRIEPAWLGSASCLICACGCLTLAISGPGWAIAGAIALGAAMGAEADLIAILTARHFPLSHYGRTYAQQYAGFMLAAGVSPMWIGYLAERTGGYQPALFACALLLLIPAALFGRLPKLARRHRPSGGDL